VTVINDALSTIVTFGADATGILAQSIGGGGGIGGKSASNLATSKSTGDGGNGSSNSSTAIDGIVTDFKNNGFGAINNYNNLSGAISTLSNLLGVSSSLSAVGDDDPEADLDTIAQSRGKTADSNESSSIQLQVSLGGSGGNGGSAGAVLVNNAGEVATLGAHSDAIIAQAVGGGGGKGGAASTASTNDYSGSVTVGGTGGAGGNGGQPVVINSGSIITMGALSNGIVAQSVAGGGGIGGVSASSPILIVPTSWMIRPTGSSPYSASRDGIGESGVPPISWMISRKVSCMCFAWFTSCSENFAWKRSTGMP
jgi:hypothetical protein